MRIGLSAYLTEMEKRLRRPKRTRKGVALLLVVAVIIIAGLAMVGVTRNSLQMAESAIDHEWELQQRWGTISLQRTLLQAAPKIFADLEKASLASGNTGPFPNSVQTQVQLGGISFAALLADEQAKLNLNTVYHSRGKASVAQSIRKLNPVPGLQPRLMAEVPSAPVEMNAPRSKRPMSPNRLETANEEATDDAVREEPQAAFHHWGQVFELSKPLGQVSTSQMLPLATSQLTCWGRGEVNIARAPNEVVEANCRGILGPGIARKLIESYRENPVLSLNQIALQLKVNEQDIQSLGRLVTTQSNTYSLWLSSESQHGRYQWLAVSAPVRDIGIRTERFRY